MNAGRWEIGLPVFASFRNNYIFWNRLEIASGQTNVHHAQYVLYFTLWDCSWLSLWYDVPTCADRNLNIIHTCLRNMNSFLKVDVHRISIKPNSACSCGHPVDDRFHYCLVPFSQRKFVFNIRKMCYIDWASIGWEGWPFISAKQRFFFSVSVFYHISELHKDLEEWITILNSYFPTQV